MKKTIELDSEFIDKLTVMNLVEYRDSIINQLIGPCKEEMLLEDFHYKIKVVSALDTILADFGVEDA
jgi:hypothetical protein